MFPIETISAKMLDYYVDRPDTLIIDLREPESYRKSHIRGAVNIPYEELSESPPLPKEKLLIFYCDRGGASMAAARDYVRRGYRTRSVIGGFGHTGEEIARFPDKQESSDYGKSLARGSFEIRLPQSHWL